MLCVAIGTYLSVYPLFLLVPILLLLETARVPQVLMLRSSLAGKY